jgi:transcriptional regulator with XRE-family HTH domain
MRIRMARGLTQTQLAEKLQSTQRNISHYETVAECPPGPVIVQLAKILQVSADELLGLSSPKASVTPKEDPETKRLWKRFQRLQELPEKDRRAVIRLINSLKGNGSQQKSA